MASNLEEASKPEIPTKEETEVEQSPPKSPESPKVATNLESKSDDEQNVAPNEALTETDGRGGPSSPHEYLNTAKDLMKRGTKAYEDEKFGEAADCFSRALAIRIKYFGELAPECTRLYIYYGIALLYDVPIPERDGGVEQEASSKNLESARNQLHIARSNLKKQPGKSKRKALALDSLWEVAHQSGELSCRKYYLEAILEIMIEPEYECTNDVAYCEKAVSLCKTQLKQLMDELYSSSASEETSIASELNQDSSQVPSEDPSTLQKKDEINTLTDLKNKLEDKRKSLISTPTSPTPTFQVDVEMISNSSERTTAASTTCAGSENTERTSTDASATPTSLEKAVKTSTDASETSTSSGNAEKTSTGTISTPRSSESLERNSTEATSNTRCSTQMSFTSHGRVSDLDSPIASTAGKDVTNGVVGRSETKRRLSLASADCTPTKKASSDEPKDKSDGSAS